MAKKKRVSKKKQIVDRKRFDARVPYVDEKRTLEYACFGVHEGEIEDTPVEHLMIVVRVIEGNKTVWREILLPVYTAANLATDILKAAGVHAYRLSKASKRKGGGYNVRLDAGPKGDVRTFHRP